MRHLTVVASAVTDPTQILTLPFVLFRTAAQFGLAMFRQSADFVTAMFEVML